MLKYLCLGILILDLLLVAAVGYRMLTMTERDYAAAREQIRASRTIQFDSGSGTVPFMGMETVMSAEEAEIFNEMMQELETEQGFENYEVDFEQADPAEIDDSARKQQGLDEFKRRVREDIPGGGG